MHKKSVAQLVQGLREQQFSSVEVTRCFLDRINTLDGQYNSFISVDETTALAAAEAAEGDFLTIWSECRACEW